jgi:hypothetical protein
MSAEAMSDQDDGKSRVAGSQRLQREAEIVQQLSVSEVHVACGLDLALALTPQLEHGRGDAVFGNGLGELTVVAGGNPHGG